MNEAIVLAGGRGLRLKGHVEVPKPFLVIKNDETLLDAQIKWLFAHDFEHIILAISRENFRYLRKNYSSYLNIPAIDFSIEEEQAGTAVGLKKALEFVETSRVYCFNIDDVVFYDPRELLTFAKKTNAILVKRARLPFGVVKFDKKNFVTSFEEKPQVPYYVSCGHYVFQMRFVKDNLPLEGDLERTLLMDLAKMRVLKAYPLVGKWITINTYKDLVNARKEGIDRV